MDLSFVIVNYFSRELKNCIFSIIKNVPKYYSYEIIVVNNSGENLEFDKSSNMSSNKLSKVVLINNKNNLGYGSGANRGIRWAGGKYVCILNPDILINESIFDLVEFMNKNKNVNIAGPKLLNSDDSLQYSCRRFPSIKISIARRLPVFLQKMFKKSLDLYEMKDHDHEQPRQVDWISGSFMFLRGKFFFDEKFFMYFEDVDLCKRVGNVWYYPKAYAQHSGGYGSMKVSKLLFNHLKSMSRYYLKS